MPSVENYQEALQCLKTALKIQRRLEGNVADLERAILTVAQELFFLRKEEHANSYLSATDQQPFYKDILDERQNDNVFKAFLDFADSRDETQRSSHVHFLKALVHEYLDQPLLAAENYGLLAEKNLAEPELALRCLRKACSFFDPSTRSCSLDYPAFLEKLCRERLLELLEKTGDEDVERLLREKDAIHMVFERALATLARQSPQEKVPSCFICANPEETTLCQWLCKILVFDLEKIKVENIFFLKDRSSADDYRSFQTNIRTADRVLIVCTPELKKASQGDMSRVREEIRLARERYNERILDKTISLLYLI